MTLTLVLAYLVKIIHLIVCIALIVIVLFQADKGEGLAGAFGGGASATIFGERGGETQISKMTTMLAIVFMVTSLVIAVWGPGWDKAISDSKYSTVDYNPNTQPAVPVVPGMPGMPGVPGVPNTNAMPSFPMGTTMPMGTTETPATVQESVPVRTPAPVAETTPAQTPAPVVETTPAPAQTSVPAVEPAPAPIQTPAPVAETIPAPVTTIQNEPSATPVVVPAAPLPEEKPTVPAQPNTTTIPGVNER